MIYLVVGSFFFMGAMVAYRITALGRSGTDPLSLFSLTIASMSFGALLAGLIARLAA